MTFQNATVPLPRSSGVGREVEPQTRLLATYWKLRSAIEARIRRDEEGR